MALQSRKTTFSFQNDAMRIPDEPLHFDRYEQFAENMREEDLIEYIMSEYQNYQTDRVHDVSSSPPNALQLSAHLCGVTSASEGATPRLPASTLC